MDNSQNRVPFENNKETIWYLESTSPAMDESIQGTAVAIRLYRQGALKNSAETYLLTCTHNIRAIDPVSKKPYGPILPKIMAWKPNTGYNPDSGTAVEVFAGIKPYSEFNVDLPLPDEHKNSASSDWVILKINDPSIRNTYVPDYKVSTEISNEVDIYGYSGGDLSFINHIVNPIKLAGPIVFKGQKNEKLVFISKQGSPGLSGGGVFNKNTNELVGIHRSKTEQTETISAISLATILNTTSEQGYFLEKKKINKHKYLIYMLGIIAAILIVAGYFWNMLDNESKFVNDYCNEQYRSDRPPFFSFLNNENMKDAKTIADNMSLYCDGGGVGDWFRGVYYYSDRSFDTSISYYKSALEKANDAPFIREIRRDLAEAYTENNNLEEAIDLYSTISPTDHPSDRILHYNLGRTFSVHDKKLNDRISPKY